MWLMATIADSEARERTGYYRKGSSIGWRSGEWQPFLLPLHWQCLSSHHFPHAALTHFLSLPHSSPFSSPSGDRMKPFSLFGKSLSVKRSGGLAFYCYSLPWACQICFPLYLLVKQLLSLQDWRPAFPTLGGRVMLLSRADTSCRCPFSEPT